MKTPFRRGLFAHPLALFASVVAPFAVSCSSGLDSEQPCNAVPVGSKSGNVTAGLFWGFPLKTPAGEPAAILEQSVAGAVIPGAVPGQNRHVAFYAFSTDAKANDAGVPGEGRWLDRDGLGDSNGLADVFVAAVVEERVDQRAFSYSLAGKFRHPRCLACHSVAKEPGFASAPLSTVFEGSTHPMVEGVLAPQPGTGLFQHTREDSCLTCHEVVLDALAVGGSALGSGWRNPQQSLNADFRLLSTARLADAARRADESHFRTDRRVGWALDAATLPSRSVIDGPFTPADDDHDGIVEPFDTDGRRRAVPGGSPDFLAEIDAFLCSGAPDDTRGAIADVALVSRAMNGSAPDGGGTEPDIAFVAASGFDGAIGGVAGTLFIAYSSEATDIDPLATSGVRQVYRASFDVVVQPSGNSVNLLYTGAELLSVNQAGDAAGDGASTAPSISSLASASTLGNAGGRVAFVSDASNLAPGGAPGAVFLRDLVSGETVLVSDVLTGCSEPAVDPTGQVVAFVTPDADAMPPIGVSDTNGVRDVYFSRVSAIGTLELEANFPQRASRTNGALTESDLQESAEPDVILAGDTTILVAFSSGSELDALGLGGATPQTNVFVHSYTGVPNNSPVRFTRQASLARSINGSLELPDGDSRRPSFPGRSDRIVFETEATNLDSAFLMQPDPDFGIFTVKSGDENSGPDLVMGTLGGILDGSASSRIVGLSVSPAGAFGDGETVQPVAAGFVAGIDPGKVLVAGLTFAQNLGAADNHSGIDPLERTPWMSFVLDSAPEPTTGFQRTSAILRSRCMPCHAVGGANAAPFGLGANDGELFNTLTTTSRNCPPVTNYVVAGDADSSLIVQVMEGATCGLSRMPQGLGPVPQNLIDVIRDWIDGGALETD